MKYLSILFFCYSILCAGDFSIEPLLEYHGISTTRFVMPVLNSAGTVTALLNEKELLSPEKPTQLLYTFEQVPDYVQYDSGVIYCVKDSTLLIVNEKEERTFTVPEKVRNISLLNDTTLLLQSGFGLRLSTLYQYSLTSGKIITTTSGYGNWVLDKNYCYLIAVDSAASNMTKLRRVERKTLSTVKEWDLSGRPRAFLALDKSQLWALVEPRGKTRSLPKLELCKVELESDEISIEIMPFTAGGSGDVNGDIQILTRSEYSLAVASYGAEQLYLISPDRMDSLTLQERGGFGRYYTNSLYQKGDILYVMFGGKLCLVDLKTCQLKSATDIKNCNGIIGGEKSAFLLYHNRIEQLSHGEFTIAKPLIHATPWQYGGVLAWAASSENSWRFGERRASVQMIFPQKTVVSRITLLDCDIDTVTRVAVSWRGGSVELTKKCANAFKGEVVIPDSVAFYSDIVTLEIDIKSDSVSTIGGIVLE